MKNADNQNFAKRFGEFIRNGRIRKKLSQQELADHLGMNQSYLSRIEQGARSIDFELAVKICAFLTLDLNDFINHNSSQE